MDSDTARADERLMQLLADRATEGVDAASATELDRLLASQLHYRGDELDWAAAMIDLAAMPRVTEPMPDSLRSRVLADAIDYFDSYDAGASDTRGAVFPIKRSPSRFAWYVAAASIVLAISGWWQVLNLTTTIEPQIAQYSRFLRETRDVVRGAWDGKVAGYENVSGEFAWSGEKQDGFLRFKNLPPNDPNVAQYQLWIVDPSRDKHPIDGGVFDIDSAQDAIVAIHAKLPVDQPSVFAITLEKPGGVVVSAGPLLIVGTVGS